MNSNLFKHRGIYLADKASFVHVKPLELVYVTEFHVVHVQHDGMVGLLVHLWPVLSVLNLAEIDEGLLVKA